MLHDLLHQSEPLLLFMVIGVGYLVGQLKIKGFGLGIAGVLFAGLAFGAWKVEGQPPLELPQEIAEIGLILFVYAVGLTSGPGFFTALRENGIRFNLAVLAGLLVGAAVALFGGKLLGLSPGLISGAFCGGLTNTPALAATTQLVSRLDEARAMEPTLGFSVTYPLGVVSALMAFQALILINGATFAKERKEQQEAADGREKLVTGNFEVRNPELFEKAIGALRVQQTTGLIISRVRHKEHIDVPTKYTVLHEGDVVVAVGHQSAMEKAVAYFGALSQEHLELNREKIEMRRILVSNKKLVGIRVGDLELDHRFNAQITRLRRADFDMVPSPEMKLELGDRLRVVMPREKVAEVTKFFGDSDKHVAELDYTAITLGISLGVLVGMIPIPLPGGSVLKLGFAGGPLIVALILGKLGRTGPIVWSIPLEANLALRHIGLLFFLAGVGVRAGSRFFDALGQSGWQLLVLGFLVTLITTGVTMYLLRTFAGAGVIATMGATSGMQTQPATLARAYEVSKSNDVYVHYATTYPVGMIGKILIAQLLFLLAR